MKTIQLLINNNIQPFAIKEFQGQRIVTLKDIDDLHQRTEGTARRNFNENKARFIQGVDYFILNSYEAKSRYDIIAPNGLVLMTESGYLMLVKSFQDDLAWQVQRQLVHQYFRVKQHHPVTIEDMIIAQAESVKSIKQKVEMQDYQISQLKLVVDNEVWVAEHQKRAIQSAVNRRVKQLHNEGYLDVHYQSIYGALKSHFGVAKYDKIPRKHYETAIKFISGWYPAKRQNTGY